MHDFQVVPFAPLTEATIGFSEVSREQVNIYALAKITKSATFRQIYQKASVQSLASSKELAMQKVWQKSLQPGEDILLLWLTHIHGLWM